MHLQVPFRVTAGSAISAAKVVLRRRPDVDPRSAAVVNSIFWGAGRALTAASYDMERRASVPDVTRVTSGNWGDCLPPPPLPFLGHLLCITSCLTAYTLVNLLPNNNSLETACQKLTRHRSGMCVVKWPKSIGNLNVFSYKLAYAVLVGRMVPGTGNQAWNLKSDLRNGSQTIAAFVLLHEDVYAILPMITNARSTSAIAQYSNNNKKRAGSGVRRPTQAACAGLDQHALCRPTWCTRGATCTTGAGTGSAAGAAERRVAAGVLVLVIEAVSGVGEVSRIACVWSAAALPGVDITGQFHSHVHHLDLPSDLRLNDEHNHAALGSSSATGSRRPRRQWRRGPVHIASARDASASGRQCIGTIGRRSAARVQGQQWDAVGRASSGTQWAPGNAAGWCTPVHQIRSKTLLRIIDPIKNGIAHQN
ncbi:hypothetical protein GGX14DRAFT_393391 [Mycena pura]|uniref:Uncharacterized protein n=1 Tax=Mycena pura TaxID=153505 RepID=A0AAD6VL70_9AGAR|nr:hypothetical protein GGX14DRAFT_393391 [Mycena pura]